MPISEGPRLLGAKAGIPKLDSSSAGEYTELSSHHSQEGSMGDQFNMSGDFRGAILNIRSTLTNVQQNVNEIRTENVEARAELAKLIAQLSDVLREAPEAKQEQAEAVAQTAKALVDTAKSEKPNKTLLQISGEGLKQAAQNLADVLPAVVTIAAQIVTTVMKLGG